MFINKKFLKKVFFQNLFIFFPKKKRVVKPLMVATEKILKYLNKNVKIEESN
jgi:hypothetical protein